MDVLASQINGYKNTALIYTAVKLNLPDIMQQNIFKLDQLAAAVNCSKSALGRLMNALVLIGICDKPDADTYQLTESGFNLAKNSSFPHRELVELAVEQYWDSWVNLAYCVINEKPAFEYLHGMGPFPWRLQHENANVTFNAWLGKETSLVMKPILDAIDLKGINRIADIGGGSGSLLSAFLHKHPHTTGVLFDQIHVIAQAKDLLRNKNVFERIEFIDGNFFNEIPVKADVYILKSIIHDWDDERAKIILNHCSLAMNENSRLLLIERLIDQHDVDHQNTIMVDIHMMAVTGGLERTLYGYKQLMLEAGLDIIKIIPTDSGFYIMEAMRI